jgi:hypothetical protein
VGYARPHVAKVLQRFLKQNRNKKKIIEQMGYTQINTADGFDYRRT